MTHETPTSPVRALDMVFTREPTSMLGTTEESKAWIAATAADTMVQIAQGRPEGGGRDAEAKTSRGGLEVSQDDAPNRDMTHKAPSSPVRSTDMVFTGSTETSMPGPEGHTRGGERLHGANTRGANRRHSRSSAAPRGDERTRPRPPQPPRRRGDRKSVV